MWRMCSCSVLHITAACFFSLQSDISSFAQFWRSQIEGGKNSDMRISLFHWSKVAHSWPIKTLKVTKLWKKILPSSWHCVSAFFVRCLWYLLMFFIIEDLEETTMKVLRYVMGYYVPTWVGAKVNSLGWEKWKEVSIPRQYNLQGQPLKIDQRKTGSPTDRANFTKSV